MALMCSYTSLRSHIPMVVIDAFNIVEYLNNENLLSPYFKQTSDIGFILRTILGYNGPFYHKM